MQVLASNDCKQQRNDEFPHKRAKKFSPRAVGVSGLVLCAAAATELVVAAYIRQYRALMYSQVTHFHSGSS
jgi:hypothetical protein